MKLARAEPTGSIAAAALALITVGSCSRRDDPGSGADLDEVRAIASEAYVYGLPMVLNYKTMYAFAIDESNTEYKAPFNRIHNTARVYTPQDTTVVTPNADTPYSVFWLDLRAEPMVLSLPRFEADRYYSVQIVDLYTYIVAYLGSRTTGQGAGHYLIAGPGWRGEMPAGLTDVVRAETDHVFGIIRTQLLSPADLPNVAAIQTRYRLQPLSAFLGEQERPAAPRIDYPDVIPEKIEGEGFFEYLDFLLGLTEPHPTEVDLRDRLAALGIGGDVPFEAAALSPTMRKALDGGAQDGKAQIQTALRGKLASGGRFGTRDFLGNDYLNRALGAVSGLYGNSREEAFYAGYRYDAKGEPHDTGKNDYVLRFGPGQLPPVRAFWSVTMYDAQTQLLSENPLGRYLINSPMLDGLQRDSDGGLTLYLQQDSPGEERESNWLPAPNRPMYVVLRLYWPEQGVLDGAWKIPTLESDPR